MWDSTECPFEQSVVERAASSEPLPPHVATCERCRASAGVVRGLRALAAHDARHSVPPAEQVWWKAQIVRRFAAREQVERPLEAMQWIQVVAGLAASLILLVWQLPVIVSIPGTLSGSASGLVNLIVNAAPTRPLFMVALASACLTVLAGVLLRLPADRGTQRWP